MKDKSPIRILTGNQKDSFRVTTSIENISKRAINISQELSYLEEDYSLMIQIIKDMISLSSRSRKTDPRLYWLVGDNIVRFLERIEDIGFYLIKQNSTFSRDIGISESLVKKIVSFRKRFSKLSMVNPTIPCARYKDNKVSVKD